MCMKRKIIVVVIASLITVGGILAWGVYSSKQNVSEVPSQAQLTPPETKEDPKTLRIVAVGDNIPHDSINAAAKTTDGYDYTPLYSEVTKFLTDGDVTYCNQEAPSAGAALGISGYPTFNAPQEFSRDLKNVGCKIFNIANNHIADKGQSGIDMTIENLEKVNPLAFTGANRTPQEQAQPKYFEVKGVKFAFIAFTDLSNNNDKADHSVNMFSNQLVEQLAQEASKNSDYVIASAHWGVEDSQEITPSQRGWAQLMADNGVDLVLGEGPHVLQPVEMVKAASGREVPVWYSLGNFMTTQLKLEELTGGMAVLDFDLTSGDMKLQKMSFMPTYMHYEWTADQAAREDLMSRTNIKLYPLANATEPLSKSLFGTTVEQQTERINALLNSAGTKIEIIPPDQF